VQGKLEVQGVDSADVKKEDADRKLMLAALSQCVTESTGASLEVL